MLTLWIHKVNIHKTVNLLHQFNGCEGFFYNLFAGLREQLSLNNVPKAFKGIPIALVTASILAMAFMGFSGLV